MPDGTYAPQSPDLSSFFSTTPPRPSNTNTSSSSYAPRSPNLAALTQATAPPLSLQQQQNFGAYQPPSNILHQNQIHSPPPPAQTQFAAYEDYNTFGQQDQSYLPPIPDLPPAHVSSLQPPYAYAPQPQLPQQIQYQSPQEVFLQQPPENNNQVYGSPVQNMSGRGNRAAAQVKMENGSGQGPSMGIDVKTKFPVARIKRIMQADEEVGKVAQVTPVAVSKALELFMISLVTKSAALAREGNSKRVTAQHLKRAIEADEQFDFLGEIVAKVVEGPDAGGKRVKDEDGSSGEDVKEKKKKRGGRKKAE